MKPISVFRLLTLLGYFGLIFFIMAWHLFIHPLAPEFISITLLMQVGPLMFALKGILHGRAYTHAWGSYLALLYFIMGVWFAATADTRQFGVIICLLSINFFIGAVFYARLRGRADKLLQQAGE